MFQHILVAVDGSAGAAHALAAAAELADRFDSKLTLLHVLEPLPRNFETLGVNVDEWLGATTRRGEQLLADALVPVGCPAERVLRDGATADVICEEAEKRAVGLIVLGSRGLGTVSRWLLGSVSDRVVHLSARPVLVVR